MTILGIDIGIRNFAYCVRGTYGPEIMEIVDILEIYNTYNTKKTFNEISYEDIHVFKDIIMTKYFNILFFEKYKVTSIRIESMPIKSSKKLWLFSHIIYGSLRKCVDNTKFIHGKLKYTSKLSNPLPENLNTYSKRKKYSKEVLVQYLKFNMVDYTKLGKKLDDVADAFLLTYI